MTVISEISKHKSKFKDKNVSDYGYTGPLSVKLTSIFENLHSSGQLKHNVPKSYFHL